MRTAPLAAMLLTLAAPLAAQRPVVERAEQLPMHVYPVSLPASVLVQNAEAFDVLATSLRRDLERDLREYDIQDGTTRREYYDALSSIAFLQGRYDDAVPFSDSVRALQIKPAARLLTGLLLRPQIAAARAGSASADVFARTLARELAALPYDSVDRDLRARLGSLAILSPAFLYGYLESTADSAARSGNISTDVALTLVSVRSEIEATYPFRDEIVRQIQTLMDAHHTVKPEIWRGRDVSLDGAVGLAPVTVAISDVGVDAALFSGRMWVNAGEIPGNGKDDDGNGFVDDVHGIGWTWDGVAVPGVLRSTAPYTPADLTEASRRMQGFSDLQANVDSPEARAVKREIAGLAKEQVAPFFERISFFSNYAHGTHVAGIAARGNPAIRLQVHRLEFPYEMRDPVPTRAQATGFAAALRSSVEYYRRTGVRVVNMSWGYGLRSVEHALEVNRVGTSEEERRALAKEYFSIVRDAFRDAIASAPDVLFVSAAGNSDENNAFSATIPASFDLPNTLTVGAVDQAGDEAPFTSFGHVDLYASGYQVESVLPGGQAQRWSGTSMASPQVVNLAAKLLAARPALTVAEVKRLILQGADEKTIAGGRSIRLLNARRSFELAGIDPPRTRSVAEPARCVVPWFTDGTSSCAKVLALCDVRP